jgi:peptidoglycan/xylan/chitin deacetylase (PgdA/CDA1 family)
MMLQRHGKVLQLLSKVPLSVLATVTRTNLVIPYYHLVSDVENACVKHLYPFKTVSEFRHDIEFLATHYAPITLPDLIEAVAAGRPFDKKVFCLTFDDGFREMHDVVAPILMEKGISATFFVNSAFVDNKELCYLNKASVLIEGFEKQRSPALERHLLSKLRDRVGPCDSVPSGILSVTYRGKDVLDEVAEVLQVDVRGFLASNEPYLTSSQINALIEKGFSLGGHSVDHPVYAGLSLEEQIDQTLSSVEYLRKTFRLSYGAFAFPHHDRNVSGEFFRRIAASGLVDITFGTGGLSLENIPTHFQRVSLEKPVDPAGRIMAFHHWKKLSKMVTMSATVRRT